MRPLVILFLLLICFKTSKAQNSINQTIERYNSGSIPYISIDELKLKLEDKDSLVLLDTRSFEEYTVSHLKNAVWVGFKKFEDHKLNNIKRGSKIIVYCSVGVRSEKVGEKIKALGYYNIKNLYGGIFLWVNKGYPIYKNGSPTEEIHTYNNRWEKYVNNGIKVN